MGWKKKPGQPIYMSVQISKSVSLFPWSNFFSLKRERFVWHNMLFSDQCPHFFYNFFSAATCYQTIHTTISAIAYCWLPPHISDENRSTAHLAIGMHDDAEVAIREIIDAWRKKKKTGASIAHSEAGRIMRTPYVHTRAPKDVCVRGRIPSSPYACMLA